MKMKFRVFSRITVSGRPQLTLLASAMWFGYFSAYQQINSVTPNGLFEKQHFDEKS